MRHAFPETIRCRRIAPGDRDGLVKLFTRSFPSRDLAYWQRAVDRLQDYTAGQAFPHHGYVLVANDMIVGALLMIFWRTGNSGASHVRCNLSSWCVDDRFRSFASLLVSTATRDKSVTYLNISPERLTRPTVEAQGFTRYCDGLFIGIPLLSRAPKESVRVMADPLPAGVAVDPSDVRLMEGHTHFECLRAWCVTNDRAYPFIFVKSRRVRNLLPTAHVVYCPDADMLQRFAVPLGRYLARLGIFVMSWDANHRVSGLAGVYLGNRMPKYFKGPNRPRLGDLAFTELTMFGI